MELLDNPVMFLDIDGVLQPLNSHKRFEVNKTGIKQEIVEKFKDNYYLKINNNDLAAVYLDWEQEAISNLKILLESTNGKIVLHSDWRAYHVSDTLLHMFKIHGLDKYIIGQVKILSDLFSDDIVIGFDNLESKETYIAQQTWVNLYSDKMSWDDFCKEYEVDDSVEVKYKEYKKCYIEELRQKYCTYNILGKLQSRPYGGKIDEIILYIEEHNLQEYVIIDDKDLHTIFGNHALVVQDNYFSQKCLNEALCILGYDGDSNNLTVNLRQSKNMEIKGLHF